MNQILDHGWKCTCGLCGHTGDFDLFTSTPINGDLPAGHYQCPECKGAWQVVGKDDVIGGQLIPVERKITEGVPML